MSTHGLPANVLYALARVLVKLPYDRALLSSTLALLLANLDPNSLKICASSKKILEALLRQVLAVDSTAAPSGAPNRVVDLNVVPNLPEAEPPAWSWQESTHEAVAFAEETVWSSVGENALDDLLARCLTTITIHNSRLGYVPGNCRERKSIAGLDIPCRITPPWFAGDSLWTVNTTVPYGKDITEFYLNGGGVYSWIEEFLSQSAAT